MNLDHRDQRAASPCNIDMIVVTGIVFLPSGTLIVSL
jgi:hypothetical protein